MTISTFYPPDSDNDGTIKAYEGNSQTWTFMRDHAGLWSTDNEEAHTELTVVIGWNVNGSNTYWDRMQRSIMIFDTSSIPDGDDMNEAALNVWFRESAYGSTGLVGNATSWSSSQKCIVLTQGTTASDQPLPLAIMMQSRAQLSGQLVLIVQWTHLQTHLLVEHGAIIHILKLT